MRKVSAIGLGCSNPQCKQQEWPFRYWNRDCLSTTNMAFIVKSILAGGGQPSVFSGPSGNSLNANFSIRYRRLLEVVSTFSLYHTFIFSTKKILTRLSLSDQFWKSLFVCTVLLLLYYQTVYYKKSVLCLHTVILSFCNTCSYCILCLPLQKDRTTSGVQRNLDVLVDWSEIGYLKLVIWCRCRQHTG